MVTYSGFISAGVHIKLFADLFMDRDTLVSLI